MATIFFNIKSARSKRKSQFREQNFGYRFFRWIELRLYFRISRRYEYLWVSIYQTVIKCKFYCKFMQVIFITSQHAKKEINFPPSLVWSSIRIFGLGWGKVVAIFLILLDVALHEMERALKSYIIFYMVPTRLSVYVFHGARLVSNEKFIWVEF